MARYYPTDDISLAPIKKDFLNYNWEDFRKDITAGFSVAFLTVPQAMAYALLAGLPISCGLFAAIYSALIAAFFGSSRHLIVGPSNAIAILIQSGTTQILYTYYRDLSPAEYEGAAILILTQITFLTGCLQMFAAWCKLGRLSQFVSHSVVIAYVAGVALAVVINQIFPLVGLPPLPGIHPLYEHALYFIGHLHQVQLLTAAVGLGSLALLILLKRMKRPLPIALITLTIAAVIVEAFGLSSYSGTSWFAQFYEDIGIANVPVVGDTGEFDFITPKFNFPFFDLRIMNGALPVAVVIALLSVMDTASVTKSIAASSGQRLSLNQEIFGIGLGNLLSAFIGGMPISASPSRTALNFNSGAQTRFAAIFNVIFVWTMVSLLGFAITRIPLAALAALLLLTAVSIVNVRQLKLCMRATKADAFVLWVTFLSCFFFSLDVAFYIGVTLSITLYLKKAAIPQLVEYEIEENGDLKNLDPLISHVHKAIRVIKVEGELFFGAADLFQTTLKTITEDDSTMKVIILQLKNARDIDATSCLALQQLYEYLRSTDRHLVACGLTPQIWEVLNNSGLVEQIGLENLFSFDDRHPHQHMQQALHWAKQLVEKAGKPVQSPEPAPFTLDPTPALALVQGSSLKESKGQKGP